MPKPSQPSTASTSAAARAWGNGRREPSSAPFGTSASRFVELRGPGKPAAAGPAELLVDAKAVVRTSAERLPTKSTARRPSTAPAVAATEVRPSAVNARVPAVSREAGAKENRSHTGGNVRQLSCRTHEFQFGYGVADPATSSSGGRLAERSAPLSQRRAAPPAPAPTRTRETARPRTAPAPAAAWQSGPRWGSGSRHAAPAPWVPGADDEPGRWRQSATGASTGESLLAAAQLGLCDLGGVGAADEGSGGSWLDTARAMGGGAAAAVKPEGRVLGLLYGDDDEPAPSSPGIDDGAYGASDAESEGGRDFMGWLARRAQRDGAADGVASLLGRGGARPGADATTAPPRAAWASSSGDEAVFGAAAASGLDDAATDDGGDGDDDDDARLEASEAIRALRADLRVKERALHAMLEERELRASGGGGWMGGGGDEATVEVAAQSEEELLLEEVEAGEGQEAAGEEVEAEADEAEAEEEKAAAAAAAAEEEEEEEGAVAPDCCSGESEPVAASVLMSGLARVLVWV